MKIEIDSKNQIFFNRSEVFDKIIAACNLADDRQQMMWFVHNGVTLRVGPTTRPAHLFCAWLDAQRSDVREIGPDIDPLIIERLVQVLQKA